MLKIISTACAALMTVTAPFVTSVAAMPVASPAWDQQRGVVQVQGGAGDYGERISPRWGRWDRGWDRRDRKWRRDVERRGNHAYWRGHRGYRDRRPGYRRHGDFWFPPAAFIAGAIIGGAIANQAPAPRYRGGDTHTEWCYARYRSYRAHDNTFQPYNGPRRQCRSPYG